MSDVFSEIKELTTFSKGEKRNNIQWSNEIQHMLLHSYKDERVKIGHDRFITSLTPKRGFNG